MGRLHAPRGPSPSAGLRGARIKPMSTGESRMASFVRACLFATTLAAGLIGLSGTPVRAQAPLASSKADKDAKMLVEANELVQNADENTVSANGNVRIYYDGRTLEADKVVYNKTTKRLFATGHAKLTEKDGTVYHGDTFDLTDDFRDGFVDSLRSDTTQKTHLSSPRAERVGGETTVFEKGTYTACDACADHPDKPPLWRVRAKKIISQKSEQMIYYEDAYLEFLGIPVAYVPYLSSPDPSVNKKSGVLAPHTFYKSQLGYGIGLPIFFNLAPDYDLTLTPTAFTQQGFFGAGEFRQRFDNGSYYIRASGIDQVHPGAFSAAPYGAASRKLRGDVDTKGEFSINPEWKFGWNIAALSDKYYLNDYSIPTDTRSSNYFSESISTLYLTGKGDRSFFDLRGYYFQGLSSHDISAQQSIAHPVLDYNRTIDLDPAKTRGIGGQLEFDFNVTSLSADSASYQSVGPRTLDRGLWPLRHLQHLPAGPQPDELLPAARHRRRLQSRDGADQLSAQIHRFDRRSLDALCLRAVQRRDPEPQHDEQLYIFERDRRVELFERVADELRQLGLDRLHSARRRRRISLSVPDADAFRLPYAGSRSPRSSPAPTTRSARARWSISTRRAWCSILPICSIGTNSPVTIASRPVSAPTMAARSR